jgi:hypothetical protein
MSVTFCIDLFIIKYRNQKNYQEKEGRSSNYKLILFCVFLIYVTHVEYRDIII